MTEHAHSHDHVAPATDPEQPMSTQVAPSPALAPDHPVAVGTPLLTLEGVGAGYDETLALRDVTFTANAGDRIAVLGPNGGGKTTLFRVVLGELAARTGRATVEGDVAIVPQTERSRLDFPVSALDVVLMGTIAGRPWWRSAGRRDREAARDALAAVGLGDRVDATFGELSGGQRQRVLVARALVRRARVLLLDEPYRGLDATSARRLDDLITALAAEGRTLLIATHDVAQARAWDRVLCLNGRQVAYGPPDTALTAETLAGTYGGDLVRVAESGELAVVAEHHCG
ncbi:metal ABC transporter ATP-binding protein [Patulibacter minatonensis]|uniref:metal ABC transporter ATP-binding protein n=1 Tax=Patulibacter minatonensis TaxID=298163 RepID=UPI0004B16878|nr:metal ABC transporter ATP-binding protein [Patulibacter minatonensis]